MSVTDNYVDCSLWQKVVPTKATMPPGFLDTVVPLCLVYLIGWQINNKLLICYWMLLDTERQAKQQQIDTLISCPGMGPHESTNKKGIDQ